MTEQLQRAALFYADLGYAVFPCAPGAKQPLTAHGLLDATIDPTQIERWRTEHPRANLAIRTDGLVVIDIDGSQNAWLAGDPDKLVELAGAPLSLTPRGGRHFIFCQPAGRFDPRGPRLRRTLGLAIPRRVASPQSPTPLHQAGRFYRPRSSHRRKKPRGKWESQLAWGRSREVYRNAHSWLGLIR